MEFVEVANVDELDDGQMVGFEVDERRILLAKVEGEFFAIGATCTHERSNLDQGALLGHVVYCPLHYSAFDVRSGAVLGPPAECPVPAHEVKVEGGKVLVCTQPLETGTRPEVAVNGAGVSQDAAADLADVSQAPAADVPGVSQDAPADVAAVSQDGAADVTEGSQVPPEPVGAPQSLAERVARLEQTVRELQSELARAKPSQAAPAGVAQAAPAGVAQAAPARASQAAPMSVDDAWSHQPPRFMGRLPSSARYLPVAIAIPVGLVALLVLTAAVLFEDGPAVPDGEILFEHFIGHGWIDVFTLSLVGVVGLLAATGVRRFYRALQATVPPGIPRQPFGGALRETAGDVVRHKGFSDWTSSDVRRGSHLAIFYGFIGLVAATTGAALYTEIFPLLGINWHENELSLPIWDPVKIVGNVGGIALLIGLAQVLSVWRRRPPTASKVTYADWFFPGLLVLTAVTGFLTEILRFAGVRMAYPAYAVHLVFVFALFVYFPFSKFAHVIYHPAGLTFGRQIRRKPAATPAPTDSPVNTDAAAV
jgi:quinone-modifying oxidoreductase, subunit QmoC